jgi:hypothetical protein
MNVGTVLLASKIAGERRAAAVAFTALCESEVGTWEEVRAADPTPDYIWQIKEATRIRQLDEAYAAGYLDYDEGDIDLETERAIENRNDLWASMDDPRSF